MKRAAKKDMPSRIKRVRFDLPNTPLTQDISEERFAMPKKDIPYPSIEFTPPDESMLVPDLRSNNKSMVIPSILTEPTIGPILRADRDQRAALMLRLNRRIHWEPASPSDSNAMKFEIKVYFPDAHAYT